jgi:hypothetical protein
MEHAWLVKSCVLREATMGFDVAGTIGAPEIVGTKVLKRGATLSAARGGGGGAGGGLVGALAGTAAETLINKKGEKQKTRASSSDLPDFGKLGYLALTDDAVVLLKVYPGGLKGRLGEVVARVPRSEISTAEFESSAMYASGVTIVFAGGDRWALEAPRTSRKDAKTLVQQLAR